MWAGLVTLSSLIGKRVHLEMGHFDVFANIYIVFVAPPGGRKSTSMDFCGRFLEEAKGVPVSVDCVTKEAIVGTMQRCKTTFIPIDGGQIGLPFVYSPLTILADEFSELIGPSREGMISFLTTIYTKRGNYDYETIKRGVQTIENPYLTLLGCTTPAWITARLKDDVISGGFSRRAVFVYESERPERIAFPKVTPEMREAWNTAMAYAQVLKKIHGKFTWDEEARTYYKDWYDNFKPPQSNPMLVGYYETCHMQLLKIAQLISLSESTDLVLRRDHLEFGQGLLTLVEQNLARVFEGVGRNELNGLSATLCDILRAAGGSLSEKKVYTIMFAGGTEFEIKQVIDHLLLADKIIRVKKQSPLGSTVCLMLPDALAKYKREQLYNAKSQTT